MTNAEQSTDGARTRVVDPLVGVIMGSDSDWPVMQAAAAVLTEFDVPFEAGVYSAHRTPQRMLDWAGSAADRGLRVVIAGAGGAAHLPGMVASATVLPVIGVPVPLRTLDGMDSLLSIVQMPAGIPVATVSIGGAHNAGLLAVRMLAGDTGPLGRRLRADLARYADGLQRLVLDKHEALQQRVAEVMDPPG
nr:5-(carboxyamino)imidazole ribonucleotide mutase [Nakamurella leprariae]